MPVLLLEPLVFVALPILVRARNRLDVRARGDWQCNEDERFEQLPELVKRIEARKADG